MPKAIGASGMAQTGSHALISILPEWSLAEVVQNLRSVCLDLALGLLATVANVSLCQLQTRVPNHGHMTGDPTRPVARDLVDDVCAVPGANGFDSTHTLHRNPQTVLRATALGSDNRHPLPTKLEIAQ
jgi:hypothetical protein